MSDLVERLRSPIRYPGIEHEAADEIERLSALLDQTVRERETYNGYHQAAVMEIERLSAQVKTQRGALMQFVAACESAPPTSLMIEIGMACKVAKSALSSTKGRS